MLLAAIFLLILTGVTIRRNIATAFERAQLESVERENAARAEELVSSLRNADIAQVSEIVDQLQPFQDLTGALLTEQIATSADGSRQKLNLSLALLATDEGQIEYLFEQLLSAESDQFQFIRDLLSGHTANLTPRLWEVATDSASDNSRRPFRAACALATYDAKNPGWKEIRKRVAADLVTVNPAFLGSWTEGLQPVAEILIEPLSAIYCDEQQGEVRRSLATAVLSEYAKDNVEILTELVSYGDENQFGVLYPVLQQHEAAAVRQLNAVLQENIVARWEDPALDPSWQVVEPSMKHAIESAADIFNDRFALCQTMPLEQFAEMVESFRASGYRPLRFRPFAHQKSVLVATVWTRDGRDWRLEYGLSDEEAILRDEQLRSAGFAAVDVAGYLASSTEKAVERYGAVWVGRASDDDDARIYVDATPAEQNTVWNNLYRLGFPFLHGLQSYQNVGGQLRFCGVNTQQIGDGSYAWNQTPHIYERTEHLGKILWDNDVASAAEMETTEQRYQQQLTTAESKLAAKSDDLDAMFSRAIANYYLGDDEVAMKDLDFYIEKRPSWPQTYTFRAVLHARWGNAERAKRDQAKFAELNQNPIKHAYLDAIVAAYLGDDVAGMKRLEAAISKDPTTLYDMACAYSVAAGVFREKNADKSRGYAERAVALLSEAVSKGYSNQQGL